MGRRPHLGRSCGSRWASSAGSAGELPRDRRIVIVCRTGSRSGYAADALTAPATTPRNLAGGLFAWAAAALPLEPAGGYVL